jgi:hypothetical protein
MTLYEFDEAGRWFREAGYDELPYDVPSGFNPFEDDDDDGSGAVLPLPPSPQDDLPMALLAFRPKRRQLAEVAA